jgi:hypothetical protein
MELETRDMFELLIQSIQHVLFSSLILVLSITSSSIMGTAPQYVTFNTSVGSFTVELYTEHAPKVCFCC